MTTEAPISVRNAQRRVRVELESLRDFAWRALRYCTAQTSPSQTSLTKHSTLHVVLISDARMAALHKKFMNIDGPTDVLTFQHGEIFISVETAQQNAARFRTSLEHELRLYLVHGLLHLQGFDDISASQAAVMAKLQSQIVAASA